MKRVLFNHRTHTGKAYYHYLLKGDEYVACAVYAEYDLKYFKRWCKTQREVWGKYPDARFVEKHWTLAEHNAYHVELVTKSNLAKQEE
jgi:hypothetical protein